MCTERTEYMMKDLEFLEHVIDQKSQMIRQDLGIRGACLP